MFGLRNILSSGANAVRRTVSNVVASVSNNIAQVLGYRRPVSRVGRYVPSNDEQIVIPNLRRRVAADIGQYQPTERDEQIIIPRFRYRLGENEDDDEKEEEPIDYSEEIEKFSRIMNRYDAELTVACRHWQRRIPQASTTTVGEVYVNEDIPALNDEYTIDEEDLPYIHPSIAEVYLTHLKELICEILYPRSRISDNVRRHLQLGIGYTIRDGQPRRTFCASRVEPASQGLTSDSRLTLSDVYDAHITFDVLSRSGSTFVRESRRISPYNEIMYLRQNVRRTQAENDLLRWYDENSRDPDQLPLEAYGIFFDGNRIKHSVVYIRPGDSGEELDETIIDPRRVRTYSWDRANLSHADGIPAVGKMPHGKTLNLWAGCADLGIPANQFPYEAVLIEGEKDCGLNALWAGILAFKHKRLDSCIVDASEWNIRTFRKYFNDEKHAHKRTHGIVSPSYLIYIASTLGFHVDVINGCNIIMDGNEFVDTEETYAERCGHPPHFVILQTECMSNGNRFFHYFCLLRMIKFNRKACTFTPSSGVTLTQVRTVKAEDDKLKALSLLKSIQGDYALEAKIVLEYLVIQNNIRDEIPKPILERVTRFLNTGDDFHGTLIQKRVMAIIERRKGTRLHSYVPNLYCLDVFVRTQYWGYDLETVPNPETGYHEVYSVVVFKADWDNERRSFRGVNTKEDIYKLPHLRVMHNDVDFRHPNSNVRLDCANQMFNFLFESAKHDYFTRNIVIGFNNQRFDNFLYLGKLLERKSSSNLDEPNFKLLESSRCHKGYSENNGMIRKIQFHDSRGHFFEMVDITNYVNGSLRQNCEDFKIPSMFSKSDLDHARIQNIRDRCKSLEEFVNFIDTAPEPERTYYVGARKHVISRQNILDYNSLDVLATMALYGIVRAQFLEITKDVKLLTGKRGVDIDDYLTLPQATNAIFKAKTYPIPESQRPDMINPHAHLFQTERQPNRNNFVKFPWLTYEIRFPGRDETLKMDYDTWKLWQEAMFAGRAEMFRVGVHKSDGDQYIIMVDVVSLYAFVQLACDYPYGDCFESATFVPNKHGIWPCCIISQPDINIVPLRETGVPLNWKCKYGFKARISTVDINVLRKNNAQIVLPGDKFPPGTWMFKSNDSDIVRFAHSSNIPVEFYKQVEAKNMIACNVSDQVFSERGHYWTSSIPGDELYACLIPFKNEKTRQDRLKARNDPASNPAMRSCVKTGTCSLYGKMGQRPILTDSDIIATTDVESRMEFLSRRYNGVVTAFESNSKYIMVTGEKPKEAIKAASLSPVQLGVFILAYARAHMYLSGVYQSGAILTDTDSAAINTSEPKVQELLRRGRDHTGVVSETAEDGEAGIERHTLRERLRSRFGRFHLYDEHSGFDKEYGDFDVEKYQGHVCLAIRPKVYTIFGKPVTEDECRAWLSKNEKKIVDVYGDMPPHMREELEPELMKFALNNIKASRDKVRFKGVRNSDRYFDPAIIDKVLTDHPELMSEECKIYLTELRQQMGYLKTTLQQISLEEQRQKWLQKGLVVPGAYTPPEKDALAIKKLFSKFNRVPDVVKRKIYELSPVAFENYDTLRLLAYSTPLPILSFSMRRTIRNRHAMSFNIAIENGITLKLLQA